MVSKHLVDAVRRRRVRLIFSLIFSDDAGRGAKEEREWSKMQAAGWQLLSRDGTRLAVCVGQQPRRWRGRLKLSGIHNLRLLFLRSLFAPFQHCAPLRH